MSTDTQTEQALREENAELRARLEEAEETLRAIRGGEVDALVVGEQIYMLESADAASNRFRGEVLAQVNDAVIAVDNDDRVTYFNPAAERQYGWDASSVLGRELGEVLRYRWLRPEDEAAAQKALGETGVWRGGNIHVMRSGEEIQVESTVNVLRDGGGAAVGLLAVVRDISEHKQAEDALRVSEERFRALVTASSDALYRMSADWSVMRQLHGGTFIASTEEPNPGWLQEYIYPEDQPRVLAAVGEAIRARSVFELEHRVRGADGNAAWTFSRAIPMLDADGEITEWFGAASDVTKRKQAEEALRASRAQLQELVETAPVGIYLVDEDFRIRQINPTALPVFGGIPDPVGRDFDEVIHILWSQEYADEVVELFRHTLETGEPHFVPERIERRRDLGVTEYYEWQLNRVPLPDGRNGVVCYFRDISAAVFARQAIAESEERLRLTMESVTDYAILTTDAEGRINSWNVGAERVFGYAAEEIVGRNHAILFTPEDREQGVPEDEMRRAREAGRAEDERWHVSKRGVRFYASGVMSPLRADGVLTGYVKVARDLTERKEWEDALRRAHDELEERVRERTAELQELAGRLLGEVKERAAAEERVRGLLARLVTVQEEERRRIARELHDSLGQQLAALHLSIDMIRAESEGRAQLREHVERTRSIFERLNSEVDFLAWELRPAALDSLGLDAALQTFVREWSEHFGVEADYRGPGDGASRLGPEVETNLYRIVQEALQNVHKHAGATHVSVILEQRDGRAVLVVEDNGRGYDADEEEAAGTNKGMGVTNLRERAALLGGEVEIESAAGSGATVYVRVPAGGPAQGGVES